MKEAIPGIILMAVILFYSYYAIKNHDTINREMSWRIEVNMMGKEDMKKYILYRNSEIDNKTAEVIVDELIKEEKETKIPAVIGLAIITTESNFDTTAKGYNGKKLYGLGLMQINHKLWLSDNNDKNLYNAKIIDNKNDLHSPKENIRAGYHILSIYYNQCIQYQKEGRLNGLGYYNIYHCSLSKYFGTNKDQYYDKILKTLGDYMIFTIQKR